MHDPAMDIDLVDIDEAVLRVAETDFHMEKSPQIRPIAADGRTFVRSAPAGHYDAIILDAFTIGGRIPFHLITKEFFALCRDRLAAGGVLVMNINSAAHGEKARIYQSMYKTIDAVFPQTHAFVVGRQFIRSGDSTNIILVAVNDQTPLSRSDWEDRADAYESNSYVDRTRVRRMIDDLVSPPTASVAALFTDDYAPIETMTF
jgi:spermidine synthase